MKKGYNVKKYFILLMVLLSFISCGRWRTTKLKPNKLCSIVSGSDAGNITLKYDNDGILDISFRILFHKGNIYTADNVLKRVQILEKNGSPVHLLGSKNDNTLQNKGVNNSFFNFSIIGSMAVDSNENIYVQNRFISTKRRNKNTNNKHGFAPIYILVFNKSGTLLYTLGKRGSPNIPFNYVEKLKIDDQNRLFVISRSFDTWSVYRFTGKKRDFSINFGDADFKNNEDEDELSGKIENIEVYKNGENLLISVVYYQGSLFIYRKVYNYSIAESAIDKTILEIPEPKNELFTMIDDRHIYLWDVENHDVKFVICNLDGDIINNILIELPENNESFSEIQMDDSGNLFSYHVNKRNIDVLEWR